MLTVVPDQSGGGGQVAGVAPIAGSELLIDEIVRGGARRMLAEALRAKVEAYVAQFAGERDENGHRDDGALRARESGRPV